MRGSKLPSTWLIVGLFALGAACVLDQSLGNVAAFSHRAARTSDARFAFLDYAAPMGLPPVMVAAGLILSIVLMREGRRAAAAAVLTTTLVVIGFSARVLAVVDLVGWHVASTQALVAGRTVATTAIATVVGAVLYRERFTAGPTSLVIGLGFPLLIGASRVALGVHSAGAVIGQWTVGTLIGLILVYAHRIAAARPAKPALHLVDS